MKDLQLRSSTIILKIIFIVSVGVIFFIGGITYKHITVLKKNAGWVEQSQEVNMELERLISYLKDAETGQRGFLLSGDTTFLQPYNNSRKLIKESYNELAQLTSNSRTQRANLKQLLFFINKRENYLSKGIYIAKNKDYDKEELRQCLLIGKNTMDSIRKRMGKMMLNQKELLESRQKLYNDSMNYTPLLIYITLLVTLLLITFSFIKMNRDLVKLRKTIGSLSVANEANNLAEIVGEYGSWQLNLNNNEFKFSDNEYRLLGVAPQSFKASLEEFNKFVHPEDVAYVQENADKIATSDILRPFTYRVIRKDGEIRYFRALGRLVKIASGDQTFIGTTSDVTEEVLNNKLIEDRNRELESNNKELTAFNYIASHDLQEPLRKIETFLSRLVSKDYTNLSSSGQQYVSSIQSSASRMRILIEDLLQFSRTNKTEKVFEIVNLNTLLDNAKQDLTQAIEEKKATIVSALLPTLNAIPFQIQQLFINLIGNSIKYSKENVLPVIKINCTSVHANQEENLPNNDLSYHKITFEDNGIGFDQEYVQKIFVLFSRLHNKNEYAGTGIGLAICKKIVENHKGYIFAKGIKGTGAIFNVYLPKE